MDDPSGIFIRPALNPVKKFPEDIKPFGVPGVTSHNMQNTVMEPITEESKDLPACSDEEVMQRYARGEAVAFEELFQRHKQSVYAFIRLFLTASDQVDDVFQTVFFRLIRNRGRYQPTAKFTTWLFTLTRSACIDAMRQKKSAEIILLFPGREDGSEVPGIHDFPSPDRSPREASYLSEVREAIDEVIQSLPMAQREVLLLREKTDLTFEEIGRVLGCPANTVKSRMHYALLALRRGLKERGIEG